MLKKIIGIAAAVVTTQAFAATIGAIAAKQGELDAAELDAKIAKAKADATGPTATLPSKVLTSEKGDPSDAIVLNGIIGIGDDLRASVSINHVGVVMKKGDAVLGWKADAVSDYEVTLIKDGKHGGRKMTLRMVGATPKPELPAIIPGLPQLVPPIATQSR